MNEENKAEASRLMAEIRALEVRMNDPKETLCRHCINLSLLDRYNRLKEIGAY